jgi:hypothetical protein
MNPLSRTVGPGAKRREGEGASETLANEGRRKIAALARVNSTIWRGFKPCLNDVGQTIELVPMDPSRTRGVVSRAMSARCCFLQVEAATLFEWHRQDAKTGRAPLLTKSSALCPHFARLARRGRKGRR